MSFKETYSDAEWYILQCAPVYVLSMVAGIDGKIDQKEIKIFSRSIIEQTRNNFGFCQEIYQSICSNIDHILRCDSSGPTALKGLIATNVLLKKINDSDATLYKRSLVHIGNQVAESSGGVFAKKRSQKELQMLALIIKVLGLT